MNQYEKMYWFIIKANNRWKMNHDINQKFIPLPPSWKKIYKPDITDHDFIRYAKRLNLTDELNNICKRDLLIFFGYCKYKAGLTKPDRTWQNVFLTCVRIAKNSYHKWSNIEIFQTLTKVK